MERESEQTKHFTVQRFSFKERMAWFYIIAPGYHNVENWVFKFLIFCTETPLFPMIFGGPVQTGTKPQHASCLAVALSSSSKVFPNSVTLQQHW